MVVAEQRNPKTSRRASCKFKKAPLETTKALLGPSKVHHNHVLPTVLSIGCTPGGPIAVGNRNSILFICDADSRHSTATIKSASQTFIASSKIAPLISFQRMDQAVIPFAVQNELISVFFQRPLSQSGPLCVPRAKILLPSTFLA